MSGPIKPAPAHSVITASPLVSALTAPDAPGPLDAASSAPSVDPPLTEPPLIAPALNPPPAPLAVPSPRAPTLDAPAAPRVVVEPRLIRTIPPIVVALPLVGLGLMHLPHGVLALVPFNVEYRSPAGSLVLPELAVLHDLRNHVLPAFTAPTVHPITVSAVAIGALTVGWLLSLALYRGGPGTLHARLFGGPRRQKVISVLSDVAGRESQVAKGVGEGAARLSRLIATNLAPGVLDTFLRRIPGLAAGLAGFIVRFLANGSAQRGLVVALLFLAVLAMVLR